MILFLSFKINPCVGGVRAGHVDGGGVLHLHLRQGRSQALSEDHLLHQGRHSPREVPLRNAGAGANSGINQ